MPTVKQSSVLHRLAGGLQSLYRTARLLGTVSSKGLLVSILLVCVTGIAPLGIAWSSKAVVNAVVAASSETTHRDVAIGSVFLWTTVELLIVATLSFGDRTLGTVRELMGAQVANHVAVLIMRKALSEPLFSFEDSSYQDKLGRVRQDASTRPLSMVHKSLQAVRSLLTLLGCGTLLFFYTPWLAFMLLAAGVPAILVEAKFAGADQERRKFRFQAVRKLGYIEHLVCSDFQAKERIFFGLGDVLIERYKTVSRGIHSNDVRFGIHRTLWSYLFVGVGTGILYGCYIYVCVNAAYGSISLGDMAMYTIAIRQGHSSFQAGIRSLSGAYEDNLYVSGVYKFLDEERPQHSGGHRSPRLPADQGAPDGGSEAGIRFQNVSFRYPHAEELTINDLSFFIPSGKKIAIVGKNGAGKSTIIKLVTGLYTPTAGEILVDGKNINLWPADVLRRRVSVIFQDFTRYQLSFKDNVSFGSIDQYGDYDRMLRATERGGASDLLGGLDNGADSQLGRMFDQGVELSGGQWQSIALSRAFMREQADIWILDEPTSALDPQAEQEIFRRFHTMSEGRTIILISHRMASARVADKILVLEKGRVIEEGSHPELMSQKGLYAELFKMQAQAYL